MLHWRWWESFEPWGSLVQVCFLISPIQGQSTQMSRWVDLIWTKGWRRVYLLNPILCKLYALVVINQEKYRDLEQLGKWILSSCSLPSSLVLVYSPEFQAFQQETRGGDLKTVWKGISMPASRKHLMWILVPSRASALMGYCLTCMGIAPDFSCTMMGAVHFSKPEGLPSSTLWVFLGSATFLIPFQRMGWILEKQIFPPYWAGYT